MAKSKDRGILQRKCREGWWVRIFRNGRERWHKCDTKSQAKALYGRLKADIREEKYFPEKFAPSQDITVKAWITRCLEGCTNKGKQNEERYGKFWSKHVGTRLLTDLTTEDSKRFQAKMLAHWEQAKAERAKNGKGRKAKAPATINRHFAFLRHIFALAVKDGRINRNPVAGVKFFPESKRTRFLTDEEITNLRKHLKPEEWPLIAFAVETCLRRGEQFTLRWNQVDLEHGDLVLPMPKGGKTRHVPLSEAAKTILRSLGSLLESPWVFPSPLDPLKTRDARAYARRTLMPAMRKAGISGATWHTLRHTGASRRVMAGVDLFTVKEILGHADVQTTARYAHLSPDHLYDAINRGSLAETVTRTVTKGQAQVEGRETEQRKAVEGQALSLVRPAGIEPATTSLEG